MKKSINTKIIILLILIVLLDQITKLTVYKYMDYGYEGHINIIGNLFGLTYILNPGMAFGIQFNIPYGKLLLMVIRILICIWIIYITFFKEEKMTNLMAISLTFILAGAIGNMIDGIFYGKLLNNAPDSAPFQWFYGQVIDMLDLHVYSGYLPYWIPFLGGRYINLFPIGNIADVVILIGLVLLYIAYSVTEKNEVKVKK